MKKGITVNSKNLPALLKNLFNALKKQQEYERQHPTCFCYECGFFHNDTFKHND